MYRATTSSTLTWVSSPLKKMDTRPSFAVQSSSSPGSVLEPRAWARFVMLCSGLTLIRASHCSPTST